MARRPDAALAHRAGAHHAPLGAGPTPRHLSTGARHRALRIAAVVVAVALVGVLVLAGYWFLRLQTNLRQAPLSAGTGTADASSDATDRLQILIVGTDTRDGANSAYGTAEDSAGTGNADVMILMDIPEDNQRITMVSFPRDLMVPIPACEDSETGVKHNAVPVGQLNSSMSLAGPGCTVDALNSITGLTIDHFLIADFNAVKELSNTIGGVQVCVNADIDDSYSGLKLRAGQNTIKGEQALAFLRSRHGVGDGSDLSRIKSQQTFLASLARKVRSDGTLGNVPKMLGIADTITRNLTVDSPLANPQSLLTIGNRLKDVDLAKVAFVTVPIEEYPADPARVQLKEPDAEGLFQALRDGRDLTAPDAPAPTSTPSATPPPSGAPAPTAPSTRAYDASTQPVAVADGTGAVGRGKQLLEYLAKDGFASATLFDAEPAAATTVYYSVGFEDVAADIAARFKLPAAQVQPSTAIYGVQLYAGADFTSGDRFVAKVPKDVVAQTAAEKTCQSAYGY
ncbi:LCP family protein [Sinomonas halotolerans]|uniref:LCP family protein n=1 Tax=Sinomonas halotolerans TaxID=1644133 RepID=A0ABU9X0U9_9MICC